MIVVTSRFVRYPPAMKRLLALLLVVLTPSFFVRAAPPEPTSLLNVSYDVTRAFYHDYNPLFAADWKQKTGRDVAVRMAHGGSSVQARAVLDGLDADVVTMNQDTDIDILAERGQLVSPDWRKRFPNNSVPYTSTILFLVRPGNPKGIKDWDDLVKPGIKIIVPQPKTSGNGRYSYLAAWGYALKKNGGDEAKAKDFVARLFKNAEVLDTGGRAATSTFALRGIGDVLLTFENEVYLIQNDPTLGGGKVEPVFPSMSIRADPPVAVVDKMADRHGSRALAEGYLRFLFSPAAQELAAKNYFRPTDPAVLARHADTFKPIELFDVASVFGSWAKAQKTHFDDGGTFDQIYQK